MQLRGVLHTEAGTGQQLSRVAQPSLAGPPAPHSAHNMATVIAASSFAGQAVRAAPRPAAARSARRSVAPRAMLETQRMATSFDGFK